MSIEHVKAALIEMGRLKLSLIASAIEKSPLAEVLKEKNVLCSAGSQPRDGQPWQHEESRWAVVGAELKGRTAEEVFDLLQSRRAAALLDFLGKLERAYAAAPGSRLVVHEGAWLLETPVMVPFQPSVTEVIIDGTFAFVPPTEARPEAGGDQRPAPPE